jgi:hypothetical protein
MEFRKSQPWKTRDSNVAIDCAVSTSWGIKASAKEFRTDSLALAITGNFPFCLYIANGSFGRPEVSGPRMAFFSKSVCVILFSYSIN